MTFEWKGVYPALLTPFNNDDSIDIEMFLKNSGFKLLSSQEWLSKKKPGFNTWSVCYIAKLVS